MLKNLLLDFFFLLTRYAKIWTNLPYTRKVTQLISALQGTFSSKRSTSFLKIRVGKIEARRNDRVKCPCV